MTFVVVTSAYMIFLYVDKNVIIPEEWREVSKSICPNLRIGYTFHYSSVTGSGYIGYYTFFYCYKAYCAAKGDPIKFSWQEGDVESKASFGEIVLRISTLVIFDELFTNILP